MDFQSGQVDGLVQAVFTAGFTTLLFPKSRKNLHAYSSLRTRAPANNGTNTEQRKAEQHHAPHFGDWLPLPNTGEDGNCDRISQDLHGFSSSSPSGDNRAKTATHPDFDLR
jgi:hypothetical protein